MTLTTCHPERTGPPLRAAFARGGVEAKELSHLNRGARTLGRGRPSLRSGPARMRLLWGCWRRCAWGFRVRGHVLRRRQDNVACTRRRIIRRGARHGSRGSLTGWCFTGQSRCRTDCTGRPVRTHRSRHTGSGFSRPATNGRNRGGGSRARGIGGTCACCRYLRCTSRGRARTRGSCLGRSYACAQQNYCRNRQKFLHIESP
jgi:hypothetical protein